MQNSRQSRAAHSPSMAKLRFKLLRVINNHEQSKSAFQELKSQIKTSLLEAENVFTSLSVPLMRLVGLKSEEMEEEGRSSFIFMAEEFSHECKGRVARSETARTPFSGESRNQTEEQCSISKATLTAKELLRKQKNQFNQLIALLRNIEALVNSHQNDIIQDLDAHRHSLNQTRRKTLSHIAAGRRRLDQIAAPSEPHDALLCLALELHRATFEHLGSALGSVEEQVLALVSKLAEHMCTPLVAFVKGLKAEVAAGGVAVPLMAAFAELESTVRERGLELELVKKRLKVEVEEKMEAKRNLRKYEEKLRGLGKLFEEGRVPEFLSFFRRGGKEVKVEGFLGNLSRELTGFEVQGKHFHAMKDQNLEERVTPDLPRKGEEQNEASLHCTRDLRSHLPRGYAISNVNRVESNITNTLRERKSKLQKSTPSPNSPDFVARRPITRSCSLGLSPQVLPLKRNSPSLH